MRLLNSGKNINQFKVGDILKRTCPAIISGADKSRFDYSYYILKRQCDSYDCYIVLKGIDDNNIYYDQVNVSKDGRKDIIEGEWVTMNRKIWENGWIKYDPEKK